jgi:hypothetical protein
MVCAALGAGSFLFYPVFRGLDRPWHYFVLAPAFFWCAVAALAHAVSSAANKYRKYKTINFAVFGVALGLGVFAGASHGLHLLRRTEAVKGACMMSPALNDLYGAIAASNTRVVYAVNYSLANPIYIFSKGSISCPDLAWIDLTAERIEELLQKVKRDPEAALVYRYCGNKVVEPQWIEWLNREPQILDFVGRLESEGGDVRAVRFRDERQAEFVLIRQR